MALPKLTAIIKKPFKLRQLSGRRMFTQKLAGFVGAGKLKTGAPKAIKAVKLPKLGV